MKATFIPFHRDNPYQALLSQSLKDLGVKVESMNCNIVRLPVVLKKRNIKILHLHWLHPFFVSKTNLRAFMRLVKFLFVLSVVRLAGVRIVWTVHNLQNHEQRNVPVDRLCTYITPRLANDIIAHCKKAKEEIITACRLRGGKTITVIPHGHYIDAYKNNVSKTDARQRLNLSLENTLFMFFGSIRPYKGVLHLIEAFSRLSETNAQLIIVGRSNHKRLNESIENRVAESRNIVFFKGFVDDDEIQVYMNAADAVVFPYKDILTSGAVMLAMSFGKACIAPRLGCIGEVLDDQGAFLYEGEDKSMLSRALLAAIEKRAELNAMGLYNKERARRFNWQHIAQDTLKVYQGAKH